MYPEQQLLDRLTRSDELLILVNETLKTLDRAIKIIVPATKAVDMVEMRKRVESGEWTPYQIKTFDLSTARTDEPIIIEGDFVHAWTDGTMDGIGLRYNHQKNDLVYFKRRNPISGFNFWKIFLTHGAQAGKSLDLMIGREASAQAQTAEITVSSTQHFQTLRSDKDTHFTGAIALNAKEDEDLTGLLSNKIRIIGVSLQAKENLSFRAIFWKTDGFDNVDLDLDRFCGEVVIDLPTNGYQIAGANQYYLDMRGLDLDYEDEDASNELHVSLMCLTAAGKTAAAAGEVVIEIYYEPRT